MKLCLITFIIFLFSSCIGDKMAIVRYQVDNKSKDTLYAYGKTLTSKPMGTQEDTLYTIRPKTQQTIQISQEICWFGDCRIHFRNDTLMDTLKIYKGSLNSELVKIDESDWKLKRTKAILKIKE